MLSEEEQAHITERVNFEVALRRQIAEQSAQESGNVPSKKDRWWETKVALIAWGALVTAVLVPWLQYYQNSIVWKRQNRFDTINYRLQTERDCLKEFSLASAFLSEGYESGRRLFEAKTVDKSQLDQFDKRFNDIQNRRFAQYAKVNSLILYFKNLRDVRQLFEQYVVCSSDFLLQVETSAHMRASGSSVDLDKLSELMARANDAYLVLETKIKEEIGGNEDENERFRL